jgi:hypothetical protein
VLEDLAALHRPLPVPVQRRAAQGIQASMATWRVLRQDDNGNVFVVADSLDEGAARQLAAELEARAHKQLYFVEEAPLPPVPG